MDVECEHVHKVYSKIAAHFSDTRFKPWPRIAQFLKEQPVGSLIADVGCGNGKYLGVNSSTFCLGSDICPELVSIAGGRGHEVAVCDCLQLPYLTGVFDAIICIAVIHHLSTEERRLSALREMTRILRSGGHMLVYVWAMEQDRRKFDAQDVMVPWHMQPKYISGASQAKPPPKNRRDNEMVRERKRQKKERKRQHKNQSRQFCTESPSVRESLEPSTVEDTDTSCLLGELSALDLSEDDLGQVALTTSSETKTGTIENVSTNFGSHEHHVVSIEASGCTVDTPNCEGKLASQQRKPAISDNAIETQKPDDLKEKGYQTFQRYYHVFRQGELIRLFSKLDGVEVVDEFFDHENWCVIAKKM